MYAFLTCFFERVVVILFKEPPSSYVAIVAVILGISGTTIKINLYTHKECIIIRSHFKCTTTKRGISLLN